MDVIILTTLLGLVVYDAMPASVVLTARQYVQKGQAIHLNCSSDFVPVGNVAEFLVNKVTYTNIRMHSLDCFNLKLKKMCSNTSCSCAKNARSYMVYFNPDLDTEKFSFSCKMRLMGNEIKVSSDVHVTIIDMPSPKLCTSSDFPLISGTVVTFTCTAAKTNSRFNFVWKCGYIRILNIMMSNATLVWSTAELKLNSTYDGISCTCSIESTHFDLAVSDFVTLRVINAPMLNLIENFQCNHSSTVTIVCSASGELSKFGFTRWIHSVGGKNVRSVSGVTAQYISILTINDCSFMDGGYYTCSAWNQDGENIIWANKTTLLQFTGPPVILSKKLEDKDTSELISVAFYTASSLVSVRWQCSDELLNHSIVEEVYMELDIHNKQIPLLAYKTFISTSSNQCSRDNYCICISNEYSVHCENIFSTKGENGFNAFWIMCALILCIVAVGISPTLAMVLKTRFKTASQSIQLEEVDNSTIDGRYLQVYESDHLASHQYDAASRPYIDLLSRHSTRGDEVALGPYIDPLPCRSVRDYEISGRPYSGLVPYQSSRGYDVTSPEYLDVQPDTDTNSSQSDQYEKVD